MALESKARSKPGIQRVPHFGEAPISTLATLRAGFWMALESGSSELRLLTLSARGGTSSHMKVSWGFL